MNLLLMIRTKWCWRNKYGYQLGTNVLILNLPNLVFHVEKISSIYLFSLNESNYGHYNEKLAHPWDLIFQKIFNSILQKKQDNCTN